MGSVDVIAHRHRHRFITIFITMESHSVISLGAIIGQDDNVMLNVVQSVLAHLIRSHGGFELAMDRLVSCCGFY